MSPSHPEQQQNNRTPIALQYLSRFAPTTLKQEQPSIGLFYPIAATVLHHAVSTTVLLVLHDNLFSSPPTSAGSNNRIACFLLFYYAFTMVIRYCSNNAAKTIYDTMWLCNTTLLVGGFYSFATNRATLSLGYMIAVCIDQVLWYVDLFFWILSGRTKFPIGVAKYTTWPSTPWTVKLTCTHHLWTIPLFLYVFSRSSSSSTVLGWKTSLRCYFLSCVVVAIHVVLSRWLAPYSIVVGNNNSSSLKEEDNNSALYLNVNLSYELWKDIKISFLQISKDNPTPFVYVSRLLWRWWVFNALVFFGLLRPAYNYFVVFFATEGGTTISRGGEL